MSKLKPIRYIFSGLAVVLGFASQVYATPVNVSVTSSESSKTFLSDTFVLAGRPSLISLDTATPTTGLVNNAFFTVGACTPSLGTICFGSEAFASSYTLTLDGVSVFPIEVLVSQLGVWTAPVVGDHSILMEKGLATQFVIPHVGTWDVSLNPYLVAGGCCDTFSTRTTATFTPVLGSPPATPEPASVILFCTGLLALILMLRKGLIA